MPNPKKNNSDILTSIYEIVKMIPYGRVTSYGAIAQCIGTKGSARFVGWAMSQSQDKVDVPAHRVVNSQGLLTGKFHFSTPNKMQELLEQEGIQVKDDKVINFKTLFWDPKIEITL